MVTPKNICAGNTKWTKQDTFLYSFICTCNSDDLKTGGYELEDKHGGGYEGGNRGNWCEYILINLKKI